MVPTTFSLAMSPVKVATALCQLPSERNKRKAISEPIAARILSACSTMPNCPCDQPKLEVKPTKTVASR
jgi:hypothetical protein